MKKCLGWHFECCARRVPTLRKSAAHRIKKRTPNHQKVLFVKISVPFASLIPCLIPPTDDRENTERTPTQLPASKKSTFLKIGFLKKLSAFLKRLDSFPKTIDLSVFKEKSPQKSPFSCISQKKSVSLRPNIQKN